jgi:hypothetical protein
MLMLMLMVHLVTTVVHMVWASSKPDRDFCSVQRKWLCINLQMFPSLKILERVTELVQSDAVQKNLLASVVLCLAELVSVLRANAIGMLSQFMPAVIKVLREQQELER